MKAPDNNPGDVDLSHLPLADQGAAAALKRADAQGFVPDAPRRKEPPLSDYERLRQAVYAAGRDGVKGYHEDIDYVEWFFRAIGFDDLAHQLAAGRRHRDRDEAPGGKAGGGADPVEVPSGDLFGDFTGPFMRDLLSARREDENRLMRAVEQYDATMKAPAFTRVELYNGSAAPFSGSFGLPPRPQAFGFDPGVEAKPLDGRNPTGFLCDELHEDAGDVSPLLSHGDSCLCDECCAEMLKPRSPTGKEAR